MASPSLRGWPWKNSSTITSAHSSYLIGSSSSTTFFNSSSISIYPFIFTHRERSILTSLSFHHQQHHHHSPAPAYCSSGTTDTERRQRKSDKQLQIGEDSVTEVGISRTEQQFLKKSKNSSYNFSGRRELWQRIRFSSKKVRDILLLNAITIIYASNIPILKEVEEVMDPAAFTVVRFAVCSIPFLPFVLKARGDIQTRNSGIELGLWVSLGYLMQAVGLQTADAGRASFFTMFTVIVVPLIDGMLGAVIPARTWFGALMSIVGVGLLESSGSPPCVGDFLSFLSALFFGIHMLRTERISRKTDKENLLPILGYQVCIVAFSSAIWYFIRCWFNGSLDFHPSSWRWTMFLDWMMEFPWIPALYTGIFSTALCLWVEIAAMRNVSATETAIIYGLEPVWGAGFAWFFLGERWGTAGWIGAALVLGGSLTVQLYGVSYPSLSGKHNDSNKKEDIGLASDKQNGFPAAPVPVSSRKDVSDLLKK